MILFLKRNFGLFVVLLLSFWAIRHFFVPGFFPMHDDTQVARVFEMGKMLKNGVFPVRWVPDLGYGYGYPIFNFYAPLAYYVGGFFTLLGFDALASTKIMMILGILLSGVFMYLLTREFWGELGGIVSGLFYVYAPYHALDIYVRGDVVEFWAYALIPLMFYGFYKVHTSTEKDQDIESSSKFKIQNSKLQFKIQKFGAIGALGFAGVILSHNLIALMITPFLLVSFLILIICSKKEILILTTLYLLFYTFLGLAISAFYWIPALLEMGYTNVLSQIGGGADFRDHFVCLPQLWQSNWGFGGSAPGCMFDGMSFIVGKLHLLLSTFAICLFVLAKFIKGKFSYFNDIYHLSEKFNIILFSVGGLFISIFLTLEASRFIWEAVPLMDFFQFPWRFLLLASFFSSFLAGAIIWFFSAFKSTSEESWLHFVQPATVRGVMKYAGLYISVILIFLLINFNSKLFLPQTILSKTSSDYTNEYALKWTASKISDEFLHPNFKKPQSEREIAKVLAIPPQETLVQKLANIISLSGIVIVVVGIIISTRKRLRL